LKEGVGGSKTRGRGGKYYLTFITAQKKSGEGGGDRKGTGQICIKKEKEN